MMRMSKDHKFDFTKATMYLSEGASVYLDTAPVSRSINHLEAVKDSYFAQLRDNMFSVLRFIVCILGLKPSPLGETFRSTL